MLSLSSGLVWPRLADCRHDTIAFEHGQYKTLLQTIRNYLGDRNYTLLDNLFQKLADSQYAFHTQLKNTNDLNAILDELRHNHTDPDQSEKISKLITCMQKAGFNIPTSYATDRQNLGDKKTLPSAMPQNMLTTLKV